MRSSISCWGRHRVVRDLVRGGEPVRVDERLGSQTAARWDRMALRLLSVGGKPCLAGGALLPHEAASPLLEAIDKMAKQVRGAATISASPWSSLKAAALICCTLHSSASRRRSSALMSRSSRS